MKKNRPFIFAALIFFMLQIVLPSGISVKAAGTDITGKFKFINDVKITDTNGNDLGKDISKSAEIHIDYTWSIPDEQTVSAGDYYTMQLPDQINIAAAIDQPVISPSDGETVAYMHIDTNGKVTITFTDYPSGHNDVHGAFMLDCHFDQSSIGNINPVSIDFTVPGLGVIVLGPYNFQQPDPTIVKAGTYNPATDEITWTITANKEGVRLNNSTITDTIASGQKFVDNSVEINSNPAVSGTDYTYDSAVKNLKINLGDITTQQVITFRTSIHDDLAAKPQGTYSYSNTSVLNYDDNGTAKNVTSNNASVPVTVKYISKDGSYDAANKRINWTIKVNESGRTISNAVVTDTITSGLTIDPSTIKLNGDTGTDYAISGQNFTYNLGNINSLQTITFSTNIDLSVYNKNQNVNYVNTAILSGDNVPVGTSSTKTVGVSSNIIQKIGAGYDASTGIITWNIVVNNNKTNVAGGAVVTDNIPIGQVYVSGSAKLDSAPIDDSGYTAASSGDLSKTGTFTYTFLNPFSDIHTISFQTRIINPRVTQANYSGNYSNTVNFKNVDINQSTSGSRSVSSQIISKTGAGYNYATREITWKLVINKNQMPITNAVITDNIPAGQEYVDNSATIDNSAPAGGFSYTPITGDPSKTGALIYVFPYGSGNTIHKTYTITFRTRITDLSIFNTNGTKTINNTASITGDEIPSDGNRSSTGTQAVNSTVINKTPKYSYGNAYIDWTVNVNSNFNIQMSQATITDKLQDGLSLNTDTVELYKAAVNSNGTLTAGAKVSLTGENVKYNPDTREFDFTFSKDAGTDPYILKFTTDVVKPGNYSNTVEFKGVSTNQTASGTQSGVWFASGSAWGTGISGSLTVIKVDSNNTENKLSGAVFQLYDQYGNIKATSAPTGSDGTAIFKSLKYDINYTLKEITPPAGYNLSSEVYAFQVHNAAGQNDITYNFKDTKIKGNIQFTKTGEDGKGLQGAEFTLYENDAATPVQDSQGKNITAVSNQNGKVQFSGVDYGTYKIKETKAPEGYTLPPVIISASFSGDYLNTKITVTPDTISDSRIRGSIKITKTDASTSAPVPGAAITVYTSDGYQVGSGLQGITGTDGTVEFDNLAYGNYYFQETNAPEGYVLNTDKHPFSIVDNGVILKDSLSDIRITGGIKITKIDFRTSAPVPGAAVAVFTSDGKPAGSGLQGVTGADGTVEFDNLIYGDYYFIETNAPEGYLLNTDKHPFSIKDNGVILTSVFSDEKIKGSIEIKKKGEDGNYLGNAEFTLFDADGKAVQKAVTDDSGTAKFTDIEYGKYTVRETRAPEGYNISDESMPVQVNGKENGITYDAGTITDTKIRANIQIKKTDMNGNALKGAEFTLYDNSGKAVEVQVSDNNGTAVFKDVVYGSYIIKETKAPEGYNVNSTALKIQINSSEAQNYTIEDQKQISMLPQTGGPIDDLFIAITGLLSVLAGTALILTQKPKKKREI